MIVLTWFLVELQPSFFPKFCAPNPASSSPLESYLLSANFNSLWLSKPNLSHGLFSLSIVHNASPQKQAATHQSNDATPSVSSVTGDGIQHAHQASKQANGYQLLSLFHPSPNVPILQLAKTSISITKFAFFQQTFLQNAAHHHLRELSNASTILYSHPSISTGILHFQNHLLK